MLMMFFFFLIFVRFSNETLFCVLTIVNKFETTENLVKTEKKLKLSENFTRIMKL